MYKSIYLCQLCNKKFFAPAEHYGFDAKMPYGVIFYPHMCEDGKQGMGLLQGTVEVKDETINDLFANLV